MKCHLIRTCVTNKAEKNYTNAKYLFTHAHLFTLSEYFPNYRIENGRAAHSLPKNNRVNE